MQHPAAAPVRAIDYSTGWLLERMARLETHQHRAAGAAEGAVQRAASAACSLSPLARVWERGRVYGRGGAKPRAWPPSAHAGGRGTARRGLPPAGARALPPFPSPRAIPHPPIPLPACDTPPPHPPPRTRGGGEGMERTPMRTNAGRPHGRSAPKHVRGKGQARGRKAMDGASCSPRRRALDPGAAGL
jgi:hypothetical protein